MNQSLTAESSAWRALVAGLALYVLAPTTFNILPLLADGATHALGFTTRQVGTMSAAITLGSSLSAIAAGIWVRTIGWRLAAAVPLVGLLMVNVASIAARHYATFVLLQGASGFFGQWLLSLAATVLSDGRDPSKAFGVANAVQTAFQVLCLVAGPTILQLAGMTGILTLVATVAGLALLAVPALPNQGRSREGRSMALTRGLRGVARPATVIALMSSACFFVAGGAYWTFIELIGEARGLRPHEVADCIAIGVSAGVLGGLVVWLTGDRFGRVKPLWMGAALTIASVVILGDAQGPVTFSLSVCLLYFAWTFSLAHQLAAINEVDVTGSAVALTGVAGNIGLACGAALASRLISPTHIEPLIWLSSISVIVSSGGFLWSCTVHRRSDGRRELAEA